MNRDLRDYSDIKCEDCGQKGSKTLYIDKKVVRCDKCISILYRAEQRANKGIKKACKRPKRK